MAKKITLNSIAQRKPDIVEASIDGETVMMSIENGQYYGLNGIASDIWTMLEAPNKVENICHKIFNSYEVSEEQCQTEVLDFLSKLDENNIIEISV